MINAIEKFLKIGRMTIKLQIENSKKKTQIELLWVN